MLLTCPTCRSGLEVPDGTSAQVRCPTCRTIFAPAVGHAPPPPPAPRPAPRPRDEEPDRARRKPPRRDDDEDDRRPRKRTRPREIDEDNDEADDKPRPKKRRSEWDDDDKISPEEKRIQRGQFARGMWGCKLLYLSFALYAAALFTVMTYWVVDSVSEPIPGLIIVAGLLGLVNWVMAAIGLGLCIASRPSPGHYGFGIAAAVAVVVHGVVLFAVVARAADSGTTAGDEGGGEYLAWGYVPTQLQVLSFYMVKAIYPDEELVVKGAFGLGLICGVIELVRLMLVMMTVSCVARAAGDEELSYRCTRAAGVGTFGPGLLTVIVLLLTATLIETGGIDRSIGKILMYVLWMGIYAVLAGMLVPAVVACREAAEACEEPFQSKNHDLAP